MDRSLNDGLRCAYENIDLRKQLAEMEENTLTEVRRIISSANIAGIKHLIWNPKR